MKSLQETLDFVCSNLIKQGKPSMRKGRCAYRGDNGTKCAAGFCIPDDRYLLEMDIDAIAPDAYGVMKQFGKDVFGDHDLSFLCRLQDLHDCAALVPYTFLSFFKENARRLATEFGLSPEVLTQ